MEKTKKTLGLTISFLIGLGILFWIVKIVGLKEIKEILINFASIKGIFVLVITFFIWIVGAGKWHFILKSLGCKTSLKSLIAVVIAAFSISYIFSPAAFLGNLGFRVFAAKKKFSLPWHKNVSSVVIGEVLDMIALFFFLIFGAVVFLFSTTSLSGFFKIAILSITAFFVVVLSFFFFWTYQKKSLLVWFLKLLRIKKQDNQTIWNVEKSMTAFLNCKKIFFWKALGLSFLKYLSIFFRIALIIYFLGGRFDVQISLAVMFILYLSYLFPLPASLGALEAGQVFAFQALGRGAAAGLGFGFVIRGADAILTLVGIIFLWRIGLNIFKGLEQKKRFSIIKQ
jgi:uncharacterized protein (TIRG00374 family)